MREVRCFRPASGGFLFDLLPFTSCLGFVSYSTCLLLNFLLAVSLANSKKCFLFFFGVFFCWSDPC